MRDPVERTSTADLVGRAKELRDLWLTRMEYHGPLSADGLQKFRLIRQVYAEGLKIEAIRIWGISDEEAEVAVEAAMSSLDGRYDFSRGSSPSTSLLFDEGCEFFQLATSRGLSIWPSIT